MSIMVTKSSSTIQAVFFSTTGNTKKICQTVTNATSFESINEVNLANTANRNDTINSSLKGDIIIFGTPIHMGSFPPQLDTIINKIDGKERFIVPLVVSGNIQNGKALNHLIYVLKKQNFQIIAAGKFVGRHSFSTDNFHIAMNRPNTEDLTKANELGKIVEQKIITQDYKLVDVPSIDPGKNRKTRSLGKIDKVLQYDVNLCKKCFLCCENCHLNALSLKNGFKIEENLCIRCGACARVCPTGALTYYPPLPWFVKPFFRLIGKRRMKSEIYY